MCKDVWCSHSHGGVDSADVEIHLLGATATHASSFQTGIHSTLMQTQALHVDTWDLTSRYLQREKGRKREKGKGKREKGKGKKERRKRGTREKGR